MGSIFKLIWKTSALKSSKEKTMKKTEHSRVLYADDNDDACLMVSILLGFSDIETITANTVAEAWRLSQCEHFDLYLLDVKFPVGCGLELCRKLRDFASDTPIIFYSGKAFDTDKQKGLAAGANAYLTKPYIDNLSDRIIQAIRLSKRIQTKSPAIFFDKSPTRLHYIAD